MLFSLPLALIVTPPQMPRSSGPADGKWCHQTANMISEAQNGCCGCVVDQSGRKTVSQAGGFQFWVYLTFYSTPFLSFGNTLAKLTKGFVSSYNHFINDDKPFIKRAVISH